MHRDREAVQSLHGGPTRRLHREDEWRTRLMPEGRDVMTKSEREELKRLTRARARVAKQQVTAREAEMMADVEEQLSSRYDSRSEAWRHITEAAEQVINEADAQIAAICKEMGIEPEFRPGLSLQWYSRGENADKERRSELRKRAQTRIKALGHQAKLAIETESVNVQTELVAEGLTSDRARSFLEQMPTPASLMPPIKLQQLEGGGDES